MARPFDVELTTRALWDLRRLSDGNRKAAFRVLTKLDRDSVFDFKPLPDVAAGSAGAWVVLVTDPWCYQCQWDPGVPALWRYGAGRGRLTVTQIVTGEYLEQLLEP